MMNTFISGERQYGFVSKFNYVREAGTCGEQRAAETILQELKKETKSRNIIFNYTDKVVEFISNKGYNDKFGARPLRRAIQKYVEDPLALEFIKGNLKENNDYVGMNKAHLAATNIRKACDPNYKDNYDYTHGGKIYNYTYTYE